MVIVTVSTASSNNETRLLVLIPASRGSLLRGLIFRLTHMCSFRQQVTPKNLSLPFVELEDCSIKAPIGVNILQRKSVVFLVGKKANGSTAAKRSRSLSSSHCQAA